MTSWESIQSNIDFIESNLDSNLDINTLSKQINLSAFYYQKLFHRLVGKSVMEYVKLRRLAHASDALKTSDAKILNIAIEHGFKSHENFTRSFKAAYKITPKEYRKNPVLLSHFNVPDLSMNYQLIDQGIPLIAKGIILEINQLSLEDDRLFSGKSLQNPMDKVPSIDYLGELWKSHHHDICNKLPNIITNGAEIGISTQGKKSGYMTYFAGSEVSMHSNEWLNNKDDIGEYENRVLPAGNYLVCTFSAENFHSLTTDALDKAVFYLFNTWLPNHKNLRFDAFMAEIYDHRSLGVKESPEMDIWVRLIN